jgi:hypothetical protein
MARVADRLWRATEAVYGFALRLRVVGHPQNSILRVGYCRHWGPSLTLPDGTLIRRGQRIGQLHFRNELMREIQAAAPGPVRALATLRARGLDGLMHLTQALGEDPALKDVQALFGETPLWRTISRLGFWVVPVPGRLRRRVVSAYQRLLMRHYSPLALKRLERLGALESRVVWISRAQLLRFYGPGSQPQRRRHPAHPPNSNRPAKDHPGRRLNTIVS